MGKKDLKCLLRIQRFKTLYAKDIFHKPGSLGKQLKFDENREKSRRQILSQRSKMQKKLPGAYKGKAEY